MILFIDNYDSFSYNLVDLVRRTAEVKVCYPDDPTLFTLEPDAVVISPGPGHPNDTDDLNRIIHHFRNIPILGVCLGAQALVSYYGGRVVQGNRVVHGKVEQLEQRAKTHLYTSMPEYFDIMRYHSLIFEGETFPDALVITGETSDCIQSFEHQTALHYGIQYHPESFATYQGEQIIRNFITCVEQHSKKEVDGDATRSEKTL